MEKDVEMCNNVLWEREITLRQAVILCSSHDCTRIIWQQPTDLSSFLSSSSTEDLSDWYWFYNNEPVDSTEHSPLGDNELYPVDRVYSFTGCAEDLVLPTSAPTVPPFDNNPGINLLLTPSWYFLRFVMYIFIWMFMQITLANRHYYCFEYHPCACI